MVPAAVAFGEDSLIEKQMVSLWLTLTPAEEAVASSSCKPTL